MNEPTQTILPTATTSASTDTVIPVDCFQANNTSTNHTSPVNQTDGSHREVICGLTQNEAGKHQRRPMIKTVHMHHDLTDPSDLHVGQYDPMTGIRTAAILGSFLVVVMAYVIYKARFRRSRWTSSDRIFIEKYKEKLQAKEFYKKSLRRKSIRDAILFHDEAAMEACAKWIQTQPLDTAVPKKVAKGLYVCGVCMESTDTPSCPVCSSTDIQGSILTSAQHNPSMCTLTIDTSPMKPSSGTGRVTDSLVSNMQNGDIAHHVLASAMVPMYKDTFAKNMERSIFKKDINWKRDFAKGKFRMDPIPDKSTKNLNLEMDYLNLHQTVPKATEHLIPPSQDMSRCEAPDKKTATISNCNADTGQSQAYDPPSNQATEESSFIQCDSSTKSQTDQATLSEDTTPASKLPNSCHPTGVLSPISCVQARGNETQNFPPSSDLGSSLAITVEIPNTPLPKRKQAALATDDTHCHQTPQGLLMVTPDHLATPVVPPIVVPSESLSVIGSNGYRKNSNNE